MLSQFLWKKRVWEEKGVKNRIEGRGTNLINRILTMQLSGRKKDRLTRRRFDAGVLESWSFVIVLDGRLFSFSSKLLVPWASLSVRLLTKPKEDTDTDRVKVDGKNSFNENTMRSKEVGGNGDDFLVLPFPDKIVASRRKNKKRCGGAFVSFTVKNRRIKLGSGYDWRVFVYFPVQNLQHKLGSGYNQKAKGQTKNK